MILTMKNNINYPGDTQTMAESPRCKVQRTNRGQWMLTIPVRYAEMMELEPHDEMEVRLVPKAEGCEIVIRKVRE